MVSNNTASNQASIRPQSTIVPFVHSLCNLRAAKGAAAARRRRRAQRAQRAASTGTKEETESDMRCHACTLRPVLSHLASLVQRLKIACPRHTSNHLQASDSMGEVLAVVIGVQLPVKE
jgi:hypothetical protein